METTRLFLRPFCEDDKEIIFHLYSDPEILRYTPFDIMDRDTAQRHLKRVMKEWSASPITEREMAVIRKSDHKAIGRCHISVDFETETGMIGALLRTEVWNMGYATEIAHALIGYCFDTLGLRRVSAICSPENRASCRVLEKCGMRREAYYRQKRRYLKHGAAEWHDELEYALLKSEWEE